jgi:hypothetical protein
MFTSAHFSALTELPNLRIKTLFYFLPDSKVVEPFRLFPVDMSGAISDPIIWQTILFNGG